MKIIANGNPVLGNYRCRNCRSVLQVYVADCLYYSDADEHDVNFICIVCHSLQTHKSEQWSKIINTTAARIREPTPEVEEEEPPVAITPPQRVSISCPTARNSNLSK